MHEKIKELLLGKKPCAIGKIGSMELHHFGRTYGGCEEIVLGGGLAINAGINCKDSAEYLQWYQLYYFGLSKLDAILTWSSGKMKEVEQDILENICPNALEVKNFPDIEPFEHEKNGWHYGLGEKKILIVTSFKNSIESQIPNYSKIWKGAKLGSCEIVECPQPFQITGESETYFSENMRKLIEDIKSKDFDIAIIGAGGYSIPLCGFVKKMGKSAIHLGGATQILFGIRGNRFDRNFADKHWYGTEHFIRPLESDVPKYKHLVEESCYW